MYSLHAFIVFIADCISIQIQLQFLYSSLVNPATQEMALSLNTCQYSLEQIKLKPNTPKQTHRALFDSIFDENRCTCAHLNELVNIKTPA